ncbi:MAG: transcription-repair coupling factor [Deltaproteobacteria bacterium]|nr:transcription-repair coupling factor [Deltaproteobacteria bacterium]
MEEPEKYAPPGLSDLAAALGSRRGGLWATGVGEGAAAMLLARLYRDLRRPMLVLCPTKRHISRLLSDLEFFLPPSDGVSPDLAEFPPYHQMAFRGVVYGPETACARVSLLFRLMSGKNPPAVIAVTPEAALSRLVPKEEISSYAELLAAGEDTDRDAFLEKLAWGGYTASLIVESPGEFSVRGGIVDVFPPGYTDPLRLEFFGDTVDSIRLFSSSTQRTIKKLDEAVILPAGEAVIAPENLPRVVNRVREEALTRGLSISQVRELIQKIKDEGRFPGIEAFLPLLYHRTTTVFDYLPPNMLCVAVEPAEFSDRAAQVLGKAEAYYETSIAEKRMCLSPSAAWLTASELEKNIKDFVALNVSAMPLNEPETEGGVKRVFSFSVADNQGLKHELSLSREHERPLAPLADRIAALVKAGAVTVLTVPGKEQAKRLESILLPYHVATARNWTPFGDLSGENPVRIALGRLSSGFQWVSEKLAFITDAEIFGSRRRTEKSVAERPRTELLDLGSLNQGDYVVHVDHGIARYEGLCTMKVNEVSADFLILSYKDNDRLYLPVDRSNLVQKFRGVSEAGPPLDKLGGGSWEKVKHKVKKDVEKIARDLLDLYAARKVRQGYAFSAPDEYFAEFEAGFAYEETPDQARTIDEVLADMEKGQPMDRLVCGDVGYGKTEVALRASFKAIADGKQVAFLAPTTILAEQHYRTFLARYRGYPVKVACLNRFRSAKEQKEIIAGISEGRVDIAIGTHRLISKDVEFRDLGLLMIDEEQRFGVSHKEKLKKFRATVDVLALTATPIPRTLNMSLSGIRDISVINTPPEQRRPITTYVTPFEDALVADAIRKELARQGQVFFVHNRVASIHAMARRLHDLVPEARFAVAHGQLPEDDLAKIMMRFIERQADVLVCTSIIESGLDIPAANTIIINKADHFGLAQMYQLRGRVGRGEDAAFAYLLIPPDTEMTRDAQRRLKVLMEHRDLGAGFAIAMSDLQIRGGGTVLGASQSGHVAAVGYEMYLRLMEEAVSRLKGEKVEEVLEPEISVDFDAFLPIDMVPDADQRLLCYRRLARMNEVSQVGSFMKELSDRFGRLPAPASQLLYKIMLKIMCRDAGVRRLDLAGIYLNLLFSPDHMARPQGILEMASQSKGTVKITPDGGIRVAIAGDDVRSRVSSAKNVLKELARRVNCKDSNGL